jgi:hypothetical protein
MTGANGVARIVSGVIAMKTVVLALIALSFLAGIVALASALDMAQAPTRPTSSELPE